MRRARRGHRRALFALFLSLVVPVWLAASAVRAQAARDLEEGEEEDEFAPREPREFHRNGFYIGAGGVYALENFDIGDEEERSNMSLDSTNSWGVNARVGYRFHPNLAAEVEGDYFQEFEFEDDDGLDMVGVEAVAVTANGKFFFLTRRVQPYVLAGAGMLWANSEREGFEVPHDKDRYEFLGRAGLGLDFYLCDEFLLNAEATYLMPAGTLSDFPMSNFVVGGQWRF